MSLAVLHSRALAGMDAPEVTVEVHLASTHFKQRTHYGSYHVSQEAVSLDGEYPLSVFLLPFRLHHAAVVGFDVGVQFAETGKIGVLKRSIFRLGLLVAI